ncbi:hypothetical protein PV326_013559 [Microctonus aethiopoides]|nr:hypothetical protein PV326_013559 [Microctonus aethiopoides]
MTKATFVECSGAAADQTSRVQIAVCVDERKSGRMQSIVKEIPKHSTVHAINKFLSDANEQLAKDNQIGATLIDLEKAFDSVWLKGLVFRLIKYKFPKNLIGTI